MGVIAYQITSLTMVYSTVDSGADQSKHQSSASLAFVRGIHRGPVNSPHKWPVTRKMFPFDDVIMIETKNINAVTLAPYLTSSSAAITYIKKPSIYRGYIWYDNAHSPTITMIKPWSYVHLLTDVFRELYKQQCMWYIASTLYNICLY